MGLEVPLPGLFAECCGYCHLHGGKLSLEPGLVDHLGAFCAGKLTADTGVACRDCHLLIGFAYTDSFFESCQGGLTETGVHHSPLFHVSTSHFAMTFFSLVASRCVELLAGMITVTSLTIGPGVICFAEARPKMRAPFLLAPHVGTSGPSSVA